MPELVAGIGHRYRLRATGKAGAGEDFGALRGLQPVRVEAKTGRERPVQFDEPWSGHGRRCNPCKKAVRQGRICVLEGEMHGHGTKIGMRED
jgi:hypothetical protein